MDVARLNLSHGAHREHELRYQRVRRAGEEKGRSIGILADLQGPKIRLGTFAAGPVVWATGETVTITTDDVPGDHDRVSTTYAGLAGDVTAGDRLLVWALGWAVAALVARYAFLSAWVRPEGLTVRNLFLTRTVAWDEIEEIRFPEGDPWVTLDLLDGESLAVMAIQRADGARAGEEARRLRAVVIARRP